MVCFEQFVAPACKAWMGHKKIFRRTIEARLAHDVQDREGRTHFVRVTVSRDEQGYTASSTGSQGSGVLMSMAVAEGFLIVPMAASSLKKGERVSIQLLQGMDFQTDACLEHS